jgi:hypothetical protein
MMPGLSGWQLAVYEALQDLTGPAHVVVDRSDLVGWRLLSIMERAGSGTQEPGQAVSLALQRLRDKGLVEFVGPGRYRLCETTGGQMRMTDMMGPDQGETRLRGETDAEGFIVRTEREVVGPRAGDLTVVPPLPPEPDAPPIRGELTTLCPDDLVIDDYQRAERSAWVNARLDKFSWFLFQELRVNLRTDGTYYVFNGQQRTLLARRTGRGRTPVPVILFRHLTREQEIDQYIESQRPGTSTSLSPLDLFWAEHARPSAVHQAINRAVQAAGARIARSKQEQWTPGATLYAIRDLERAYGMLDEEGLTEVLCLLRDAWGLGGQGGTGLFIRGAALLFEIYGAQIDRTDLAERFQARTTQQVYGSAQAKAPGVTSQKRVYGMALALVDIYNYRRTSRRLPLTPLLTRIDRQERQGRASSAAWRRRSRARAAAGEASVAVADERPADQGG